MKRKLLKQKLFNLIYQILLRFLYYVILWGNFIIQYIQKNYNIGENIYYTDIRKNCLTRSHLENPHAQDINLFPSLLRDNRKVPSWRRTFMSLFTRKKRWRSIFCLTRFHCFIIKVFWFIIKFPFNSFA